MSLVSQQIREVASVVADSLAACEAVPVLSVVPASENLPVPGVLGAAPIAADVAVSLPGLVARLNDDALQSPIKDAAAARSQFDAVIAAGAGVIAKRSERELGYAGLAARKGHRNAGKLLQSITGSSEREAARQVRLGEAMGEADAARRLAEATPVLDSPDLDGPIADGPITGDPPTDGPVAGSVEAFGSPVLPWHEPVTRALAEYLVTPEGASAIIRGMGEPSQHCDADVMRAGASDLLAYVARMRAEDPAHAAVNADVLAKLARQARDRIDPIGVSERFDRHYEARKWRFVRNGEGARTAWVEFDDESAAWIDGIVAEGMRARRGGPRFVDKAEAAKAEQLKNDPRTNDQLVFDLLMDTLRAGSLADPTIAFGTRQPGLRVIVTHEELNNKDAEGNLAGTGFLEETGQAVPAVVLERLMCDIGIRKITVDSFGNPLDVGREQRLFTAKQKVAMAYRDGGCMDPDCDGRGPSQAEAHHIDEWVADTGRTDIADGVLLCRYSHMRIHNQHWKIRREGSVYWMIPPKEIDPKQTPRRMRSKAAWRYKEAG